MNFKQYTYEFIGFFILYLTAGLIFRFDSLVLCTCGGIIGAFFGKFFNKVNGFFFEKVVNYESTPLEGSPGEFNVHFEILAKHKGRSVSIWACYTSKNIIELETLSLLLYIELKETHYKKTLEQGFDTLDFKLKDERVELLLMQN